MELVRADRYRRPLTLLAVKPVSPAGAAVRDCARVLREQLRDLDILARFDEYHLFVLLPETDARAGLAVADRLRNTGLLADARIGLATFPEDGETWDVLRAHAVAGGCRPDPDRARTAFASRTDPSSTPPSRVIADRFPPQAGGRSSLRQLFPRFE